MALRRPTEILRTTLGEVPRVILGPDPEGAGTRRVTLLVLSEPAIEIAFDKDPKTIDARDSYWSEPPGGHNLTFELLPAQTIVGRAVNGLHELSVIVEYLP